MASPEARLYCSSPSLEFVAINSINYLGNHLWFLNARVVSATSAQLLRPSDGGAAAPVIGRLVERLARRAAKLFRSKIIKRTGDVADFQRALRTVKRGADYRIAAGGKTPRTGQLHGGATGEIKMRT